MENAGEVIDEDDIQSCTCSGAIMCKNSETELYDKMVKERKSFWDIIYKPFIARELNRTEVNKIIEKGMRETGGTYKMLLPLFNIGQSDTEYKRFMKLIRAHRLYNKKNTRIIIDNQRGQKNV